MDDQNRYDQNQTRQMPGQMPGMGQTVTDPGQAPVVGQDQPVGDNVPPTSADQTPVVPGGEQPTVDVNEEAPVGQPSADVPPVGGSVGGQVGGEEPGEDEQGTGGMQ